MVFYFVLQNILSGMKINLVDTFKVSKVKMIRALIDDRIKIIKEKLKFLRIPNGFRQNRFYY